jgi:hypothetical protein
VNLDPKFFIRTAVPAQFVSFNILAGSSDLFRESSDSGTITTILQLDPLSPGIVGFDQNVFAINLVTFTYHHIDVVGTSDGRATWGPGAFVDFEIRSVPEPSALTLAIVGGLALAGIGRLRHRKKLPGV